MADSDLNDIATKISKVIGQGAFKSPPRPISLSTLALGPRSATPDKRA